MIELESWAPAFSAFLPWIAWRDRGVRRPLIRALRMIFIALVAGLLVILPLLIFVGLRVDGFPMPWLGIWVGGTVLDLMFLVHGRALTARRLVASIHQRHLALGYWHRVFFGLTYAEFPLLPSVSSSRCTGTPMSATTAPGC